MERIGIAASRMAKGNLWIYNLFVVVISFLFSFLVFIISSFSIILGMTIVIFVMRVDPARIWDERTIFLSSVCLVSLGVVVGLFNLFAIGKNIKLKKGP